MSQEEKAQETAQSSSPSIGKLAIPVWILMVALLLGYRGCIFVDHSAGGMAFSSNIYGPYHSAEEIDALLPKSGDAAVLAKGKAIYNNICSGCHQATGMGTPGVFPPLAGSDWVLDEGPNRIIRIVLNGLQGPIKVNGKQYNNVMVGFDGVLSEDDIAAVLSYVRNEAAWGNEAGTLVTSEQVKAIKDEISGRSKAWSETELLQISVQ